MTNRDIVDRYYDALARLDVEAFEALHHPDVVYHVSGHTIISGRYEGFAALKTILPLIFGALDFDNFQFARKWRIMTDGGDSITAIMEADGTTQNGQRYDQRYVHIFGFRDGRIGSIHEFFDTQLANDALGFSGRARCETDGEFEY